MHSFEKPKKHDQKIKLRAQISRVNGSLQDEMIEREIERQREKRNYKDLLLSEKAFNHFAGTIFNFRLSNKFLASSAHTQIGTHAYTHTYSLRHSVGM